MLRYIETLFRNKWRILLPAIILLVVAEAATFILLPKEYQSRATVWVDRPAFFNELNTQINRYETAADNQANTMQELLSTDAFADDIFKRAGLDDHGSERIHENMITALRKNMQISASGVHLIRISYKSENASEPQAVVKAMLDAYGSNTSNSNQEQAASAIAFYENQVKELTAKLNDSTKKLNDYLTQHPELRDRNNAPTDPMYTLLSQQSAFDRDQLDRAQQQLDDSRANSGAVAQAQPTIFRIVDVPDAASVVSNSKQRMMQVGLGLGLGFGYAFLVIVFLTWSDSSLRTKQDVERVLNLPVLTTLEYDASLVLSPDVEIGKATKVNLSPAGTVRIGKTI